jgi:replicative DNA helicase
MRNEATRVAFYHLELSQQWMLDRCVARCSGVDTRRLRGGYAGEEVVDAQADINNWHSNITFIHCPGWTAERIAADIMRLHAQGRCELAVIDYLQRFPCRTVADTHHRS